VGPAGASVPQVVSVHHPADRRASAKNEERLRGTRRNNSVGDRGSVRLAMRDIADVAYTLQVAVRRWSGRLGLIRTSMRSPELQRYSPARRIEISIRPGPSGTGGARGACGRRGHGANDRSVVREGNTASFWSSGRRLSFDWPAPVRRSKAARISLPTLPFSKGTILDRAGAKLSPVDCERPARKKSSEPSATSRPRWSMACQLLNVLFGISDAESELGQYGFDSYQLGQ